MSRQELCEFQDDWSNMNTKELIVVTLFTKDRLRKCKTNYLPTVYILPCYQNKGNNLVISERDLTVRYGNQQEVQEMLSSMQEVGLRAFVCFLSRNSRSKALLHKLAFKPAAFHETKPESLFQRGYSLSTSNSSDSPSLDIILKSYWVLSKSGIPILVLPLMDISKISILCNTSVSGGNTQYMERLYQANEPKRSQNGLTNPQHNVASSSISAQTLSPSSSTMSILREDRTWGELIACHSASNLANIICSSSPEDLCLPDVQNCTICHSIVFSPYSQEEIAQLLDLLDKKGMQDLMIVPNSDGDTPLHIAIRRNPAKVSTLLKYLPLSSLRIANNRGLTPLHLTSLLCKHKVFSRSVVCTASRVSHPKPTKWNADKESKYKSGNDYLLTNLLCSNHSIVPFNALFISSMVAPKIAVSTTSAEQESYMRKGSVKKPDTITFPVKVDAAVFTAICMSKKAHVQQKQKIFKILRVPHDFIHFTSELHLKNPLNYRGDSVLHIAVDHSEEIGILNLKSLLKHDALDLLIIEPNLDGDTPLHKSARLRNPEVFELLFEESYRSYGSNTIKQKFPKLFEPCFEHFLCTMTVVFKCGGGVACDAIFCLTSKQMQVVHAISHGPECTDRTGTTGGLNEKVYNGLQQCSDTDFNNAVMCHSARGAYLLYSKLNPNCARDCCAHVIQQYVVIPTECSPVPPYLGKKSETLRQGNISGKRCSSYCREQGMKRSDTQAEVTPRGVHEYKTTNLFPQTSFSYHNKLQRDLNKTENHVVADEAQVVVGRKQEEKMNIHVQHFNLAADCLHAQDYVRMLHSLPYCSICNPSVLSNMSMDRKTQITYLFGCGLAHVKLSKQKEAVRHFQTCESVAEKDRHMHKGDIALCNQNLGDILLAKQSLISAAEHYSKAVDCYSPETVAHNFKMIIPSLSGLYAKQASALRNASKIVEAVQAYRNAIATAESKKDKLSAHTSLGNLYQSVGGNASALSEYEHSIKLSEELEDYVFLGWAHGNMGNACLGLYQRDKAVHHLDKSLKLALSHEPTPQAIGRAFNNLGTAHQALNEYDKAQENYDLALGQSIYGNDIPGQARVYGNIGNLLMVRQDYERAIPHYTEVLHLSKDRSTVSTAYHNRGCAYYELAESKKTAIFEKRPSKSTFYMHGLECVTEHQPLILPNSVIKLYRHGSRDLEEVVRFHEETLNSIKGSTKGLTLSVSLFESNSRTFHRLQDCLVSQGEWEKALVVAEQSRTRTLGELLLKKKEWQLEDSLSAPLNLDHITSIVKSQSLPVLYLSYTGARLLGWVLMPTSEAVKMGMFEVPLKDDQFEGKSFDYHLRYSLNEVLVEKSFEMYRSFDYSSRLNDPVINLYNLIGKPLCNLLKQLDTLVPQPTIQSVLVIPDSYTNLLPFTCLLATDPKTNALRFLCDQCSFQLMPSLLTMGILDQLPPTTVMIPAESQDMWVVGNPTIPPFNYNGEPWNLGKLPYATKETQWVAHILGTAPILHEQATKSAVLMRILNSKVIHIATHGSAAAGFLAFAGITSSRKLEAVDSGSVLIYPRDIEKLSISPALVVLSSCDSGRGEMKADGIQGMARAFILAGAQAVLTTLWRVPDESACIFMQFFYQYLVDGFCGSEALQKAILSVRCFSKYSQYIHWSGYQLMGRKIQFDVRKPDIFQMLETRLGPSCVFPRLNDVKKLELAFTHDPRIPTDVQILRGSPGMKPSEPLIDFIHSFHHHFKGGIFWVNGRTKELLEASTTYIEKVTGKHLSEIVPSDVQQVLVVLDYFERLPTAEAWIKFLKNPNVHIVVISKHYSPPELLRKEIDHQLLRGCNDINIQPLSMVHTIQRIVHSIQCHEQHHLAPGNEVQELFAKLAELTSGSPAIIKVVSRILLSHMKRDITPEKALQEFMESFSLLEEQTTCKISLEGAESRCISRNVAQDILSVTSVCDEVDPWKTDVQYDSWQVVSNIIAGSELSREEQLLLYTLSVFSCCPIPMSIVTEISTLIAKASNKAYLSGNLHSTLCTFKLVSIYPTPVILYPSTNQQLKLETEFVYIPQYLSSGIWKHIMSPVDKAVALGTAFKALSVVSTQDTSRSLEQPFFLGLCSLLLEMFELNYELMGKQCYQEVYKLFLFLSYHVHTKSEAVPGKAQAMITAGPDDTDAEYLSNVSLKCTARGVPVPDFTWTVDSGSGSVDVIKSGQIQIKTVPTGTPNEQMSILTLMSVQPSIATYTCHVSNLLGSNSSSAMLSVQAEPRILSSAPTNPTAANVNIGSNIVLACTAKGAPEPTFTWFREGTKLTGSETRVSITPGLLIGAAANFVTVTSILTITGSLETDAGGYSCVASNMVFGEPRSDTVKFLLTINCGPSPKRASSSPSSPPSLPNSPIELVTGHTSTSYSLLPLLQHRPREEIPVGYQSPVNHLSQLWLMSGPSVMTPLTSLPPNWELEVNLYILAVKEMLSKLLQKFGRQQMTSDFPTDSPGPSGDSSGIHSSGANGSSDSPTLHGQEGSLTIYKELQEARTNMSGRKCLASGHVTTEETPPAKSLKMEATAPKLASSGQETPQYNRLFKRFDQLIENLADLIRPEDLADKLQREKLITKGIWEEACVSGVANSKKIRPLLNSVLSQVKLNPANFNKFLSVLREFDGLQDIVQLIDV